MASGSQLLLNAGFTPGFTNGLLSLGSSRVAMGINAAAIDMGAYTPEEADQDPPYGFSYSEWYGDESDSAGVKYPPSAAGVALSASSGSQNRGGFSIPTNFASGGASDAIGRYVDNAARPLAPAIGGQLNTLA